VWGVGTPGCGRDVHRRFRLGAFFAATRSLLDVRSFQGGELLFLHGASGLSSRLIDVAFIT